MPFGISNEESIVFWEKSKLFKFISIFFLIITFFILFILPQLNFNLSVQDLRGLFILDFLLYIIFYYTMNIILTKKYKKELQQEHQHIMSAFTPLKKIKISKTGNIIFAIFIVIVLIAMIGGIISIFIVYK